MMMDDTLLKHVWAPRKTGKPLSSPHMDMMMLPDGEIRSYGAEIYDNKEFTFVVQKSFDYGMSWTKQPVTNRTYGASVQSPWSGDWISVQCQLDVKYPICKEQLIEGTYQPIWQDYTSEGTWLFRSQHGPDADFTATKIFPEVYPIQRLPLALKKRKRWILPTQYSIEGFTHPIVLLSDDDGESWHKVILPYPPLHEIKWPHAGFRWRQPGVEPVIAEHADGRLQMLLRTSQDCHYQCFSDDGGESWSTPEVSPFYSVATMPNLQTLSDGRLLAVWNHTTPLPELDHALQPELVEQERNGECEDVFTNRDVLHAAISSDSGKSWRGFREIALNPLRNAVDFRNHGSCYNMHDRSVHQNQALELPHNKVLVGYGQNPACWGYTVFDLGWLEEESRQDDFLHGLENWSVHQFLKSHNGNFRGAGHCAWNRRAGASLVPACDGSFREALQIARHPDSRLIFEKEGAVWNFPAFRRGKISLTLTLVQGSAGLRITLCDRWFNPVDPAVHQLSPFVLELDCVGRINQVPMFTPGKTAGLIMEYDQDKKEIRCTAENNSAVFPLKYEVPGTVCYLHLQSLAESADPFGVLIDRVAMCRIK